MSKSNISKVISKETITRLIRDVKSIMKNPLNDNGIYYSHHESNILKGYAMIVGPQDTPYFGGYYLFEFDYPEDYPYSPPKVTYCTNGDNIRFNPNLYKCGKVCISLLNTWRGDQWTSCQTISSILLTLCTILNESPLLNEPGVTSGHKDFKNYHRIIQYKNIQIALLDIVNKKDGIYLDRFEIFYNDMKELFLSNQQKILAILDKHKEDDVETIATNFYSMNAVIDYNKLRDYFVKTLKKMK
jgi:ubiquitin-protein ligase